MNEENFDFNKIEEEDDLSSTTSSVVDDEEDEIFQEEKIEDEEIEYDDIEEDEDEIDEGEGEETKKQFDEMSLPSTYSDEDDEDDEEDEDDNYLQKLDNHTRKNVIEDYHPELKTLNYEEIEALTKVVRDKNNNIIDPLHRTLPMMTRYEKARVLGERALQINSGAKPMIEVEPSMIDGYLIALKELEQKRIPFIIQRPLPNGGSEYWRVIDLE